MKLYRTASGYLVERDNRYYAGSDPTWDRLVTREALESYLEQRIPQLDALDATAFEDIERLLLPPIQSQEVWASGVTYFRSRNARMEESKSSGGGDFYDRVYSAQRPELFYKSAPQRVVGHQGKVAIRRDSAWSIPEPELTVLASPGGKIVGYTIGNDIELAGH